MDRPAGKRAAWRASDDRVSARALTQPNAGWQPFSDSLRIEMKPFGVEVGVAYGDHAMLDGDARTSKLSSRRDLTAHVLVSLYEGHAPLLPVRLRRTLIAFSGEPGEAVQCSPAGPSGCEPRSGALDRLDRRSYAAATAGDVAMFLRPPDRAGCCRLCRGRRPGGRQPVGAGGPQAAARPAAAPQAPPLEEVEKVSTTGAAV
jgi:hypothetical protein